MQTAWKTYRTCRTSKTRHSDFWAQMGQWVLDFLPKLLAAAVIVVVGLFIGRILKKVCTKALEKANREVGMVSFISSAVSVIIKIFTAVIAISALGVDMSVIVGGLSAVGLGITLALKNNMANVASGLQMIFTKPFKVGDYIATDDGVEGTVERVELMFSVLRTFDNKEIVIPNAKLADNVVTNFSAMENRRMDLRFSVAYGDDLLHAKPSCTRPFQKTSAFWRTRRCLSAWTSAVTVPCSCSRGCGAGRTITGIYIMRCRKRSSSRLTKTASICRSRRWTSMSIRNHKKNTLCRARPGGVCLFAVNALHGDFPAEDGEGLPAGQRDEQSAVRRDAGGNAGERPAVAGKADAPAKALAQRHIGIRQRAGRKQRL